MANLKSVIVAASMVKACDTCGRLVTADGREVRKKTKLAKQNINSYAAKQTPHVCRRRRLSPVAASAAPRLPKVRHEVIPPTVWYEFYRETVRYMMAGPGIIFPTLEAVREAVRNDELGGLHNDMTAPGYRWEITKTTQFRGLISEEIVETGHGKPPWLEVREAV